MSGWLSCSCPQQPQGSAATSDSSHEAWVAELVARPAGCRPATLTATDGARPRMGARPPSSSVPPTEGWAHPLPGARPQSASTPNVQIEVLPATSRATGGAHPQARAHSRSASSSRARGRGYTLPPPREGGSASSRRARRPRHDSGFPLDGDEARMIRDLGFYLAGLDHSSQILCGSLRTLIREATLPSVEKAWSSLVVSLREVVDGMLARVGICIYKIGICRDPMHRMHNEAYGYAVGERERYASMELLVASFPAICAFLERRLISLYFGLPGCRNTAPGGENAPASGLCFLYLVTAPCGDGPICRKRR